MTLVHRLQENGILRLGSKKSGFRYRYAGGGRPGLVQRTRIRDLKAPPAWQRVAIARSLLTGPTRDPRILARHRGARLHRCERALLRLLESRGRARPRRPAAARLVA